MKDIGRYLKEYIINLAVSLFACVILLGVALLLPFQALVGYDVTKLYDKYDETDEED